MLQPAEQTRFEELDAIVDSRLRSVLELAIALREVRDRRLWRQNYANFESYLAEKGIAKRRGNQLAAHAWVVELLRLGTGGSQQGPPPELPERVTRELIPVAVVAPERVRDVYEVAARTSVGVPTSAVVRSAARDFVRQAVPKPTARPEPARRAPDVAEDVSETDADPNAAPVPRPQNGVQSASTEPSPGWQRFLAFADYCEGKLPEALGRLALREHGADRLHRLRAFVDAADDVTLA